jgi:hypothetical protein
MRRRTTRLTTGLIGIGLMAGCLAAGPGPASAHGGHDGHEGSRPGTEAGRPAAGLAAGRPVQATDPRWWKGTDVLVTGRGDTHGYTVYVSLERERYSPRPVALITPSGYDSDDWLGYTCLTGGRRYAVATLLPRWAVNRPDLRDRGALAYSVDITSGRVVPLANEVAFKYHATNCGQGNSVALLRHLGADQESSEVLIGDAARATVSTLGVVGGQLTSAVPDGAGALALQGPDVVRLAAGGRRDPVGRPGGLPYRLVRNGKGVTVGTVDGDRSRAYALSGSRFTPLADGPSRAAMVHPSAVDRAVVSGLSPSTPAVRGRVTVVAAARLDARDGDGVLPRDLGTGTVSAEGKVMMATTSTKVSTVATALGGQDTDSATIVAPSTSERRLFDTRDGRLLSPVYGDGVPASRITAVPVTTTALTSSGGSGGTASTAASGSTTGSASARLAAVNFSTPKCAVPRNEPTRMTYGANDKQIDWAVQMASRNALTGSAGRPADHLKSGLPAYNPSADFPVPTLKPNGGSVPPAVFNGVLSQESAYRQASRRTLPGSGGNAVIGDYYGAGGTLATIDYTHADCGYGVAQVTTGMAMSDAGISANGKAKIAIDYAENVQAGMNILVKKWNQLYDAGIRVNNSDPQYAENWYAALWAYNSGIQPDARYGNTTGCTPGPACTDSEGAWGLGWTNNPRNTDYPPGRLVFLRKSYADAETPSEWPYQERVLGFAETPIRNYQGVAAYAGVTRAGGPLDPITYPPTDAFCDASNRCDDATTNGCTRADWHCWWHQPKTYLQCSVSACATSAFSYATNSVEPAGSNPWAPACDSDLGSKAIIVDDLNDPSKNIFCPSRNWATGGTFTYTLGKDAGGAPLGAIDFHQVATGFGAHAYFTGNRLASDTAHQVSATWKPSSLPAGPYIVKAHIPRAGASAGSAVYKITTADGTVRQKTVNQHEHYNHWKSLGAFQLAGNAQVSLSNVTREDTAPSVGVVGFDAVAFIPAVGSYREERLDAYAYFDGNQDLTADPTGGVLAGLMASPEKITDWALDRASGLVSAGGPQTRTAGARWLAEVQAAQSSPAVDDDGISVASWLALSNPLVRRPTTNAKPTWFDADDLSYKTRTTAVVSYVKDASGNIIQGSADAEFFHRTGDTHLPRFMREFFSAVAADYGIAAPDLSYTAENLNAYNHASTTANPNSSERLPGRAYKPAAREAVVTDAAGDPLPNGTCVSTVYTSGGTIGYRPMLGVGYVSERVDAWLATILARFGASSPIYLTAKGIFDTWFKTGILNGTVDPTGNTPEERLTSPFNQAPPIWQELRFAVCTNGILRQPWDGVQRDILRSSWMPSQYLYRNGSAVNLDGTPRSSARPVVTGNFLQFTAVPEPDVDLLPGWENAYGDCGSDTGRTGNPWNISAIPPQAPGTNPSKSHFCFDQEISPDPD